MKFSLQWNPLKCTVCDTSKGAEVTIIPALQQATNGTTEKTTFSRFWFKINYFSCWKWKLRATHRNAEEKQWPFMHLFCINVNEILVILEDIPECKGYKGRMGRHRPWAIHLTFIFGPCDETKQRSKLTWMLGGLMKTVTIDLTLIAVSFTH